MRRNSELDAKAENVKGLEKVFRKLGENYNKMGWKSKLIIGAGLGLGAGLSGAAVSGVGILGFTTLIVAQRTAALMTMYLKYEAKSPYQGEIGKFLGIEYGTKEKAMAKAMLYTALMSAGTAEAVREIRESAWAQDMNEWLGHMMEKVADKISGTSYHPEAGGVATAPSVFPEKAQLQSDSASLEQPVSAPVPVPEAAEPAAAAAAGEQASRPITHDVHRPEAPTRFEMPKHADFSIHEDDTTISPYDVTPTDNAQTDDVLSVEEVEEDVQDQPAEAPVHVIEPEEIVLKQPTEPPMVDLTQGDSVERSSIPTSSEVIVNNTGLNIPISESHLYEGEGGRSFVLGGTTADHSKIIREFFAEPKNVQKVLYTPPVAGGSHVIGWIKSPDGAIMSTGPLEEENRNWLGMKKYVEKIDPNWLRRLVK